MTLIHRNDGTRRAPVDCRAFGGPDHTTVAPVRPMMLQGTLSTELSVSLTMEFVRGRDNHQRARSRAATGNDQSRKRGCERLERDRGVPAMRRESDRCGRLLVCPLPFCDGVAPQGMKATHSLYGSALPFAQTFTTGNL